MYPDSRQPVAARPSTTERRRQGRKKARKAIRGLAMAFRVTAKWYTCTARHYIALHCITLHVIASNITVLPYGRQEYDCMEGRAPLERQHTRHCTTSSGQMGPALASSWGTPVYSRQCFGAGSLEQFHSLLIT